MNDVPSSRLQQLKQRAALARQQGNLKQAQKLYARALQAAPADLDTLYRLGTLEAERGQLTRAIKHLETARDLAPDNAVFHYALGIAYNLKQSPGQAIGAYRTALELQPEFSAASFNLGNLYARHGHEADAIAAYRLTLRYNPRHKGALANLMSLHSERQEWDDVITIARQAAAHYPDWPDGHQFSAIAYKGKQQYDRAIESFMKVLAVDPDNHDAHQGLGGCYIQAGRATLAIPHLHSALRIHPDNLETLILLGNAYHGTGDHDLAARYYQEALDIQPDRLAVLISLAEIREKQQDLDAAQRLVERALALAPDHPMTNRIAATILRSRGETAEAIRLLEKTAIPDDDHVIAQSLHYDLGKLYDLAGYPDRAIAHFALCKQHIRALAADPQGDRERSLKLVADMKKVFAAGRPGQPCHPEGSVDAPLFLIGFPRSGTTLLNQILDSHPALEVIEERPALFATWNMLNDMYPGRYPDNIGRLECADIGRLRRFYLSELARYSSGGSAILVDKLPLNIIHVGLINRLFPEARIIFALRHPCDVCLSCFMQPFEHNDAMANFYTLEDAIIYYTRVMELWALYTERLELTVHTVRYEDLVTDFRPQVARLLDFLDLPWDDAILHYNEHARARTQIRTPSYNQVTRPIYQEARFRWHRYRQQFAPYLELLAPYIDRFHYGLPQQEPPPPVPGNQER